MSVERAVAPVTCAKVFYMCSLCECVYVYGNRGAAELDDCKFRLTMTVLVAFIFVVIYLVFYHPISIE